VIDGESGDHGCSQEYAKRGRRRGSGDGSSPGGFRAEPKWGSELKTNMDVDSMEIMKITKHTNTEIQGCGVLNFC